MNTELLLQVKAHILAEPRRLAMSKWKQSAKPGDTISFGCERGRRVGDWSNSRKKLNKVTAPPCGTVACICGWAVMLNDPEFIAIPGFHRGMIALDLIDSQANELFYPQKWPNANLYAKYITAKDQRTRARIVGKVIDELIATNK